MFREEGMKYTEERKEKYTTERREKYIVERGCFIWKKRSICCKVYILVKKPKPSNLHYFHHSYTVPIKPTVSICETINQSPLAKERSCCPRHRLISLQAHSQLQARLKKKHSKTKADKIPSFWFHYGQIPPPFISSEVFLPYSSPVST